MKITRATGFPGDYAHVYLSPHFDDVPLSCGGQIIHQRLRGERVLVVGVCTGKPAPGAALTPFASDHHRRWGGKRDPIADRRQEERQAMDALGADYLWLDHLDAIYRDGYYPSNDALFGDVHPDDLAIVGVLVEQLRTIWRHLPAARLYAPLGVGNHVDHQLCRAAALTMLDAGVSAAFYEDFPYASRPGALATALASLGRELEPRIVTIGAAVDAKTRVIAHYRSQLPDLFGDATTMDAAVRAYLAAVSDVPGGFAERYWLADGVV